MSAESVFKRDRPPRVVTVLGHKIAVRIKRRIVCDGVVCHATFESDTKTIYLTRHSTNWKLDLAHECLHAVLFLSGVGQLLPDDKEESLVRAIEHGLFPLFFDLQ